MIIKTLFQNILTRYISQSLNLYKIWILIFQFITCKGGVVAFSLLHSKNLHMSFLKLLNFCRFLATVCKAAALPVLNPEPFQYDNFTWRVLK